jgi:hypothetical protein
LPVVWIFCGRVIDPASTLFTRWVRRECAGLARRVMSGRGEHIMPQAPGPTAERGKEGGAPGPTAERGKEGGHGGGCCGAACTAPPPPRQPFCRGDDPAAELTPIYRVQDLSGSAGCPDFMAMWRTGLVIVLTEVSKTAAVRSPLSPVLNMNGIAVRDAAVALPASSELPRCVRDPHGVRRGGRRAPRGQGCPRVGYGRRPRPATLARGHFHLADAREPRLGHRPGDWAAGLRLRFGLLQLRFGFACGPGSADKGGRTC